MSETIRITKRNKYKLEKIKEEIGANSYNEVITFLITFYEQNRNIIMLTKSFEEFAKELRKILKIKQIKI